MQPFMHTYARVLKSRPFWRLWWSGIAWTALLEALFIGCIWSWFWNSLQYHITKGVAYGDIVSRASKVGLLGGSFLLLIGFSILLFGMSRVAHDVVDAKSVSFRSLIWQGIRYYFVSLRRFLAATVGRLIVVCVTLLISLTLGTLATGGHRVEGLGNPGYPAYLVAVWLFWCLVLPAGIASVAGGQQPTLVYRRPGSRGILCVMATLMVALFDLMSRFRVFVPPFLLHPFVALEFYLIGTLAFWTPFQYAVFLGVLMPFAVILVACIETTGRDTGEPAVLAASFLDRTLTWGVFAVLAVVPAEFLVWGGWVWRIPVLPLIVLAGILVVLVRRFRRPR